MRGVSHPTMRGISHPTMPGPATMVQQVPEIPHGKSGDLSDEERLSGEFRRSAQGVPWSERVVRGTKHSLAESCVQIPPEACAIDAARKLHCFGKNEYGQCKAPTVLIPLKPQAQCNE